MAANAQAVVKDNEGKESTTICFEWTLRGLANVFESSKGESKSKVIKSPRFGDGRWQILFYANSGNVGTDGQTFVSLYLWCEPTTAEKETAINGKWSRDGLFNFGFEIRNITKTMKYNQKEAHDHAFYHPGAQNWGWAQFARRDIVFYQATSVKQSDSFVIICTITSAATPPAPLHPSPRYVVSKDFLDSIGGLLDDPLYSDIEFVLPRPGKSPPRKIYAARKLLRRVEYYDAMFNSGFAEGSTAADTMRDVDMADDASVTDAYAQLFDDSDAEDEDMLDIDHDLPHDDSEIRDESHIDGYRPSHNQSYAPSARPASMSVDDNPEHQQGQRSEDLDDDGRHTRPKLSHPSTPRGRDLALEQLESQSRSTSTVGRKQVEAAPIEPDLPGPKKTRVVIRDVAYTTYRAVLYYLYTNTIVFAPLSSTFLTSSFSPPFSSASVPATPAALPDSQHNHVFGRALEGAPVAAALAGPRSRKEWLADWERNNPGRPQPPSAKSVYRLADKLGLQELKERAFQHFIKSLTVDNVTHEVFSAFSVAFEDVRKIELSFLFEHWTEVRGGAMASIGHQLRTGRFPGFEEVWPLILQNLMTEEKKGESESART